MLLSLKQTLEKHNIFATKSLGQNFLLDQNITDKIINLGMSCLSINSFSENNICEIGPGPGGLTRAILKSKPKSFVAIEMDKRFIPIIEELKNEYDTEINIIQGNALDFDIAKITNSPRYIISNLPYNISVTLLTSWLKNMEKYQAMILMFQKEVAERIIAKTHTKDYGRLSVLSQLTCNIVKLIDLPPHVFTPAPKIWSSVLLFTPKKQPLNNATIEKIEKITSTVFSKRRKMLRQSLKSNPKILLKAIDIGIDPTSRPEEISPNMFLELAKSL